MLWVWSWRLNGLHLQQGKLEQNVKAREKEKQSLLQQVLITFSGMDNVNKKEFLFWLSAQRGSPLISQNGTSVGFSSRFSVLQG